MEPEPTAHAQAADARTAKPDGDSQRPDVPAPATSREVHQAAGMLTVQLDCTIDAAVAFLQARAEQESCPLERLAHDVVTRRVAFDARTREVEQQTA